MNPPLILQPAGHWREVVSFSVEGTAKTAGSKKAFYNKKLGRALIVDACKGGKEWRAAVKCAASMAYEDCDTLLTGPLRMDVMFRILRAQNHYGTGRNAEQLKPSAPIFPTKRPDTTKMLRAIEDALTGVLWKDDSQIVEQHDYKFFAGRPGADVVVYEWREGVENGI